MATECWFYYNNLYDGNWQGNSEAAYQCYIRKKETNAQPEQPAKAPYTQVGQDGQYCVKMSASYDQDKNSIEDCYQYLKQIPEAGEFVGFTYSES